MRRVMHRHIRLTSSAMALTHRRSSRASNPEDDPSASTLRCRHTYSLLMFEHSLLSQSEHPTTDEQLARLREPGLPWGEHLHIQLVHRGTMGQEAHSRLTT